MGMIICRTSLGTGPIVAIFGSESRWDTMSAYERISTWNYISRRSMTRRRRRTTTTMPVPGRTRSRRTAAMAREMEEEEMTQGGGG